MITSSASDAELIARALAGDPDAFEVLVRRYYDAAFAVALAHTTDRAEAEDVCHDAFVRASAKLAECRSRDRFRFWLCSIVRNHARNAVARARVRRADSLSHDTAASGDDPSRDVERRELRERLTRALAQLSVVQREVVLLHDLEGWPHDAIAETLGTSVETSRQHLFQARRRLRAALGETMSKEHFHDR